MEAEYCIHLYILNIDLVNKHALGKVIASDAGRRRRITVDTPEAATNPIQILS